MGQEDTTNSPSPSRLQQIPHAVCGGPCSCSTPPTSLASPHVPERFQPGHGPGGHHHFAPNIACNRSHMRCVADLAAVQRHPPPQHPHTCPNDYSRSMSQEGTTTSPAVKQAGAFNRGRSRTAQTAARDQVVTHTRTGTRPALQAHVRRNGQTAIAPVWAGASVQLGHATSYTTTTSINPCSKGEEEEGGRRCAAAARQPRPPPAWGGQRGLRAHAGLGSKRRAASCPRARTTPFRGGGRRADRWFGG